MASNSVLLKNHTFVGLFKDDKNWTTNLVRKIMFNRCKKMLIKSIEEFEYDAAED